jgi:hypothetical protein
MAFNGSGVFSRIYSWATESGSPPIAISKLDTQEADIATGLSTCITKDGQTTITAAIPFNDKRITGLGAATADADALNRTTADGRYLAVSLTSQTGDYTCVLADVGVLHPSGAGAGDTITIPANASVAYAVGKVLTFVNAATDAVGIAITSDTLTIAGTTSTGTRALSQNGVATAIKVTSTSWIISGAGLT